VREPTLPKLLARLKLFAFHVDFRAVFAYIKSSEWRRMVARNLVDVRNRIAAVCARRGRKPDDVLLVAVSKTIGAELLRQAIDAGQLEFGENYAQELQAKQKELGGSGIRWHFIGRLQSNKVKQIADYIHLIHTVDSERVAKEIQRQAEIRNRSVDVLIEVHSTDEATKSGVFPGQALELARNISRLSRVNLLGLMTMGPFSDDPDDSRPSFQQLAELKNRIAQDGIDRVSMRHLSMGMTHDFEVAIEEGATIVRIGTAIFGMRKEVSHDSMEAAS
jgi:pyridoxal phosphate enzyme (YggS family)